MCDLHDRHNGEQEPSAFWCRALQPIFNTRVSWSSSTSLLPNQPPVPIWKPKWQSSNFQLHPKLSYFLPSPPQREARGRERMASHVAAACAVETHSRVEISQEKDLVKGFCFCQSPSEQRFCDDASKRPHPASAPLPTHGFPSLLSASEGSVQLDCLGGIQDKITVCATDDSYQKARESMAQVEEETRSRSAIVIKPGGRYVGEKTRIGPHTPCTCHFGFTGVQRPYSS